ncbi:MAG: ATP-dependent endonuclease [Candidatus Gastranaerophilaceae bacterium]
MIKDIDFSKIKFIPASPEDLILALDRLTRFKYPEIKYYRVFSELLCKYFKEPRLSKNQIKDMDTAVLKRLVEIFWNESVSKYTPAVKSDKQLNELLLKELYDTYNLSQEVKILTDINININGVLALISDKNNLPLNLKRLAVIEHDYQNLIEKRQKYGLRFPVEKVVLCEGITEEILLPRFAKLSGFDFDKNGVKLISAGGKNQVAKLYCELKDELKIPIFILLDADAVEISEKINCVLRDTDSMYLICHGEFEDIFSLNLIKRTINKRFKNICECCIADFKRNEPMTKTLSEFYRLHELGDFQKADFAKELAQNLKYETDLTDEIKQIVDRIKIL